VLTELLLPTRADDHTGDEWALPTRLLPRVTRPRFPSDTTSATFSRAAAEQEVDAAEIDALIERLPVGVILTDASGCVTWANAEARRLDTAGLEPMVCAIAHAVLTGGSTRCESIELPTTRGPRRWLSVDAAPVRRMGNRDAHAAVLTVRETTAERQAAEWLPMVESLARL
jgi:PAS domain-containing protein